MATVCKNTPSAGVQLKKKSDPTHGRVIREFALQTPKKYRLNYLRAMSGTSRAAAVKAKCLDCCCWQRKEVRLCTAVTCPLWMYRPYQK
jgi:hypothetical protein